MSFDGQPTSRIGQSDLINNLKSRIAKLVHYPYASINRPPLGMATRLGGLVRLSREGLVNLLQTEALRCYMTHAEFTATKRSRRVAAKGRRRGIESRYTVGLPADVADRVERLPKLPTQVEQGHCSPGAPRARRSGDKEARVLQKAKAKPCRQRPCERINSRG
jgi:hypothetical protein